jgi:hypothetical protein
MIRASFVGHPRAWDNNKGAISKNIFDIALSLQPHEFGEYLRNKLETMLYKKWVTV